jgi:hypothetical protein
MFRQLSFLRFALGLTVATAIGGAAVAGPVFEKNVSHSPREIIVNHKGNTQDHVFVRNDGRIGHVFHDFNKGTVTHFVYDYSGALYSVDGVRLPSPGK